MQVNRMDHGRCETIKATLPALAKALGEICERSGEAVRMHNEVPEEMEDRLLELERFLIGSLYRPARKAADLWAELDVALAISPTDTTLGDFASMIETLPCRLGAFESLLTTEGVADLPIPWIHVVHDHVTCRVEVLLRALEDIQELALTVVGNLEKQTSAA